jgi:anti-anti-sigma factor
MMVDTHLFADAAALPGDRSGIACRSRMDGLYLRMWGDIDDALRAQASVAMRTVAACDCSVDIDVSDVSFIDSAGIAFIAQIHSVVSDHGQRVVLLDPSPAMIEMLDLVGIAGLLEVSGAGSRW